MRQTRRSIVRDRETLDMRMTYDVSLFSDFADWDIYSIHYREQIFSF